MHYIEQTENWAQFRKSAKGEKYFEIDNTYIQRMPLPLGKCWLYLNRAPITNDLIKKLSKLAEEQNTVYARFEFPYTTKINHTLIPPELREAHAHYQPDTTLIINLEDDEEEILKQMKPKGRYNIKLASKKGVKVNENTNANKFFELLQQTTKRDHFHGHSKEFYQKMIDKLGGENHAKLYEAKFEGEVIAAVIITFFQDTATYYYGASSNKHRNLMAPYLLQWHAIKEAKSRGCCFYDFLGIAPEDAEKHAWKGVTQFKKKFGGDVVEYIEARELVFKPFWYWVMRMVKKIRP